MKPQTIRKIDLYLGKPVCLALTAWRKLVSLVWRGSQKDHARPPRKILFIKMIEQGATVAAYAAIKRAVEMVGRENVYFWVFDENRPILDLLGLIPKENVLPIRAKKLTSFIASIFGMLFRIRKLGIDATIDMEFFARAPAILAYLTGAQRRVGLHRFNSEAPYRGDLLTHRVQYNPYLHVSAAYDLLVRTLVADPTDLPMLKESAGDVDLRPPMFEPSEQEIAQVQATLDRLAGRAVGRPIVLLNPNASDMLPLRKWPTDRFVELGKRILAEHGDVTLGITGAPSEAASAQEVAARIGSPDRCITLAGQTTLRQLLVLYTMADVLVTNDSGPGHFSAMTPIRSIVMFGPETPELFGPLGRNSEVIWSRLACSPCVNVQNHRFSPCKNNVCMQKITVEQVYDKVAELLARADAAQGAALQEA